MFSSVYACPLGHAAGVFSAPSTEAYTIFSSHISACLYRSPAFSLKVKLKRYARKENASAIQNTFFYQTGDILPTKYCQMLANSTYFSYPAPWNLGLLQDSRHIIDKDSLWPQEHRQKWTKYPFCFRRKYFLWYKCNITGHKSFRNSFGNHLKNTFIWGGGGGGCHQ